MKSEQNGKHRPMRIILVRPGATEFDEQGRLKGCLDLPLSRRGVNEVQQTADSLRDVSIDAIYAAPCLAAQQTAQQLSQDGAVRIKTDSDLTNLDHGLWHGKLIDELKSTQPKLYRWWQDHPETFSPPGGESLDRARERARRLVQKILRKFRSATIAIVVPEPLASLVRCELVSSDLGDWWQAERRCGCWETLELTNGSVA